MKTALSKARGGKSGLKNLLDAEKIYLILS